MTHRSRILLTLAMAAPTWLAVVTAPAVSADQPQSSWREYTWPLDPTPAVVRPFWVGEHRWSPGHRGVDLSTIPGQNVYSAGSGTVIAAGIVVDRPVVSVMHTNGLRTTYEPVEAIVSVGDVVHAGSTLGVVSGAHPGCPVTSCLHWGLRRGSGKASIYYDPRLLLGLGQVRLKPL